MAIDYKDAGVDVDEADKGISRIVKNIKNTWPKEGVGAVKLDIGYFANIIDIGGGKGIAMTMDGVGSKTIIADIVGDYSTIGIDLVAMNVNDLICVGAKPLSMLDYIGIDFVDADLLSEISVGLEIGAKISNISISGGEVSQLPDTIDGFDLVGSAFGLVDLDKIILGDDVAPGDAIIGIASSGIHSNGLTLARRVLFDQQRLISHENYGLPRELLTPTFIYVEEIMHLLDEGFPVKALINITGDGLLNLNRIKADGVGFYIDQLPPPQEIFKLIQKYGQVDDATMFQTFNMGIGFCIIVPHDVKQEAIDIIHSFDKDAYDIGVVVEDQYKSVMLPHHNLIGRGKRFQTIVS